MNKYRPPPADQPLRNPRPNNIAGANNKASDVRLTWLGQPTETHSLQSSSATEQHMNSRDEDDQPLLN
jgi:hypothetical protein